MKSNFVNEYLREQMILGDYRHVSTMFHYTLEEYTQVNNVLVKISLSAIRIFYVSTISLAISKIDPSTLINKCPLPNLNH